MTCRPSFRQADIAMAFKAVRPLGKNQRDLLAFMVLGRFLIVPDKRSDALEKRGILSSDSPTGGMLGITSTGLRAIADEMDAGRLHNRAPEPKERESDPPAFKAVRKAAG